MKRITLDLHDLIVQGNIRRLTFAERGAFDILLEQYIARGGSLPLDVDECCELADPHCDEEREAVKWVLKLAFRATDDGWRSAWADGLVEQANRLSNICREKAAARWSNARNGANMSDAEECRGIIRNAGASDDMPRHNAECHGISENAAASNRVNLHGIASKSAHDSDDNAVDGMPRHNSECRGISANAAASAGMPRHNSECRGIESREFEPEIASGSDDNAVSDVVPPYNPPIYKDSILIQRVSNSKRLSTSEDSISNNESCKNLKDYKDEESLGVEKRDCTNSHSCANAKNFSLFDAEIAESAQCDGVAQPDVANNAKTLDPGPAGSSRSKSWTPEELKEKQLRSFNRFWELQPRKVDKARCWAWWQRNVRERGVAPPIINGFKAYLATCNPEDNYKYAKRPLTWLRGRCWEDEGLDPSAMDAVRPAREPIRDLGFEYSVENLERTLGISLPRPKSG